MNSRLEAEAWFSFEKEEVKSLTVDLKMHVQKFLIEFIYKVLQLYIFECLMMMEVLKLLSWKKNSVRRVMVLHIYKHYNVKAVSFSWVMTEKAPHYVVLHLVKIPNKITR